MLSRKRLFVVLWLALVTIVLLLAHYTYSDAGLVELINSKLKHRPDKGVEDGPGAPHGAPHGATGAHAAASASFLSDIASLNKNQKIIIFPHYYPLENLLLEYLTIKQSLPEKNHKIVRYNRQDSPSTGNGRNGHNGHNGPRDGDLEEESVGDAPQSEAKQSPSQFHKFTVPLFNSHHDIESNDQCSSIHHLIDIELGQPKSMSVPLTTVLTSFMENNPTYFQETVSFYDEENNLQKLIETDTVETKWFRMAGSSVWLEDYGVYFMTSRLAFAPSGVRDRPVFSLVLAHIYDKNWQELPDVELVVPTNNPDLHVETSGVEQRFTIISYPSVIPIPFYHDSSYTNRRYYGPEDPRIVITKNPQGYEEPLIIFNQHHRKIVETDQKSEDDISVHFNQFRSMFMGWPWQFQRGKKHLEELSSNAKTDTQLFNRIVELGRTDISRKYLEKNWTPFISHSERQQFQHDRFIYFVYRWSNLEVLKCPLSNIDDPMVSNCEYEYRLDESLSKDSPVGELRGGTQMININDLLYKFSDTLPHAKAILNSIPADREIWIGFARAHIKDCGCGVSMYRPNFIVLTKDADKYRINHISSFLSLDVPIIKWSTESGLCEGGNVLIPNGICKWNLDEKENSLEDVLTLAISVSDATVDIIDIKGILTSIIKADSNDGISKIFVEDEKNPIFNNANIDCAMDASKQFCHDYGVFIHKQENKDKEEDKA